MDEFKNNRESKLKEIKDDISKKKAAHSKQTLGVKTMQRNLQTASLEASMCLLSLPQDMLMIWQQRKWTLTLTAQKTW